MGKDVLSAPTSIEEGFQQVVVGAKNYTGI